MTRTKYIDVKGIRTRYLEAGSGEPLLLVHGGQFGTYCSANDWDPVIEGFGQSFQALAIDKIGCGFTDNPPGDDEYTIGRAVQHASDFLDAMKIRRAHVAGHSRGGYLVCRLALERPELVQTLVIVSSATLMAIEGPELLYDEWERQASQMKNPRDGYRHRVASNSFGSEHITDEFIDLMAQYAALPKHREAAAKMAAGLNQKFRNDLLARQKETHQWIKAGGIKAPTLIMWGFNDPSAKFDPVGLNALKVIMSHVPRSEMCILNQAGHYCYREQPDAFVAAVTGFIKLQS